MCSIREKLKCGRLALFYQTISMGNQSVASSGRLTLILRKHSGQSWRLACLSQQKLWLPTWQPNDLLYIARKCLCLRFPVAFLLSVFLLPHLCLPPPPPPSLLPTPPSLFHLPSKPYWFLRLWQVMAECYLPWDNCLIIGAVMSAPLPPAYLFINVMCHLLHTQEGKPGRLNNCRAVPHWLVRVEWKVGGGALQG